MTQVVRQRARIVPIVRKLVSASMAQRVGMHRPCDDYEGCNCADLVRLNFERECYDGNI